MTEGQAMALRISTTYLYLDSDRLSCEKNWTHMPSTSESYGWPADKIQVGFKSLRFPKS